MGTQISKTYIRIMPATFYKRGMFRSSETNEKEKNVFSFNARKLVCHVCVRCDQTIEKNINQKRQAFILTYSCFYFVYCMDYTLSSHVVVV